MWPPRIYRNIPHFQKGDPIVAVPEMKRLKGSNLNINAAVWAGGNKNVLCIHGITANCRCWDLIAETLAPEYTVVAVDLRGRGRSDKPDAGYSPDHHIQDMVCLLDDLGIEKTLIMGHSLGAFISLLFAARHPQRVEKLILVDGAGDLSKGQMDDVFAGIKPALDRLSQTFDSTEAYLQQMKSAPSIQPWRPNIETYYRYEIEPVPGGVQTNIDPIHIEEESENVRKLNCADLYKEVHCPVLILRAPCGLLSQNDLLLPEDVIDKMVAQIPDAKRFDVMGANHYGIIFQPHPERDEIIHRFLGG